MRELGVIVIILFLMGALAAIPTVPWSTLLTVGLWTCAVGLLVGVPTAILYHFMLYRVLNPLGRLEKGWYWNAVKVNKQIPEPDWMRVMLWCYLGALGFVIVVLGIVIVVAALGAGMVQLQGGVPI